MYTFRMWYQRVQRPLDSLHNHPGMSPIGNASFVVLINFRRNKDPPLSMTTCMLHADLASKLLQVICALGNEIIEIWVLEWVVDVSPLQQLHVPILALQIQVERKHLVKECAKVELDETASADRTALPNVSKQTCDFKNLPSELDWLIVLEDALRNVDGDEAEAHCNAVCISSNPVGLPK